MGEDYKYLVTAVNSNGESTPSKIAAVLLPKPQWNIDLLPAGPGRDTTIRLCSDCHTPDLAAKERLDLQEWRDLVRSMLARGSVANDGEISEISVYLAKSFPRGAPPPQ